nr:ragweed homologue of Art v 1 precursor [Tanacetum cinerariifolium]
MVNKSVAFSAFLLILFVLAISELQLLASLYLVSHILEEELVVRHLVELADRLLGEMVAPHLVVQVVHLQEEVALRHLVESVKGKVCEKPSKTWFGNCKDTNKCDKQCIDWEGAQHGACHQREAKYMCFCYFEDCKSSKKPNPPSPGKPTPPGGIQPTPPGGNQPTPPEGGQRPPSPPAPPGGGQPSPPGGEQPAPPEGGQPAPPGGGQPAPPEGGQPAPPGGGQPTPPDGGQPAPPGGGQPTPPDGGQPAPPGGGQPAPPDGGGQPPPGGGQPAPPDGGNHLPQEAISQLHQMADNQLLLQDVRNKIEEKAVPHQVVQVEMEVVVHLLVESAACLLEVLADCLLEESAFQEKVLVSCLIYSLRSSKSTFSKPSLTWLLTYFPFNGPDFCHEK